MAMAQFLRRHPVPFATCPATSVLIAIGASEVATIMIIMAVEFSAILVLTRNNMIAVRLVVELVVVLLARSRSIVEVAAGLVVTLTMKNVAKCEACTRAATYLIVT